jgi:hypothetical protein
VSIRPKIEVALAATAERLNPGSGAAAVSHAKNDLATIEASSENLGRRYANDDVALAAPAAFEAKHPDGDPVKVGKRHDGVIVVFADSFIVVRGMGFGARDVKTFGKGEVSVDRITMVLDGADVPGVRINDRRGKPLFAAAITPSDDQCDATARAAVRDELSSLLAN